MTKCNEIWTIAEARGDCVSRATLQILGKAVVLASQKGYDTTALLFGGTQAIASELADFSNRVLWIEQSGHGEYEAVSRTETVSKLMESKGIPAAVLTAGTSSGLEFMPRLAARWRCGYLSSCVDVWWEGENLAVKRPVFGGKVYESVMFAALPAMATIRAGAFETPQKLSLPGKVEKLSAEMSESQGPVVIGQRTTAIKGKDLSEASRIVAGGRGMGGPENFKLVENLAEALDAAVGASRAVVDSGWRPHDEQVGKSGRTVSPELYVACGISGAIHHTLGMNTSKVVAAINADPDALIFQHADFGLVGDALKILPELTGILKSEKKND